jgi:hypothetical protein
VEFLGGAIVTTFVGAHPKVWVCGMPLETRTPANRTRGGTDVALGP